MKITRVSATDYSVVTDTVLADGNLQADTCCHLNGSILRSFEQYGHIRIGGLIRVNLGPVSLARVTALAIGETVNF